MWIHAGVPAGVAFGLAQSTGRNEPMLLTDVQFDCPETDGDNSHATHDGPVLALPPGRASRILARHRMEEAARWHDTSVQALPPIPEQAQPSIRLRGAGVR